MPFVNYARRELTFKVVYCGPSLGGKTTIMRQVHARLTAQGASTGRLVEIATQHERTLFFDFLPVDLGTVQDLAVKIQIYSVPGQVFYRAVRRLVISGADGIIFVADSQAERRPENLESLINLAENLKLYNRRLADIPLVFQYNKRDLPTALPVEELQRMLNPNRRPHFETVASRGDGIFEPLRLICKLVLRNWKGT